MSHPPKKPPFVLIGVVLGVVVVTMFLVGLIQMTGYIEKSERGPSTGNKELDDEVERQVSAEREAKANLARLRQGAELYFDARNSSYVGFCEERETVDLLVEAVRADYTSQDASDYECNDSQDSWAAAVPLLMGGYACVDRMTEPVDQASNLTGTSCDI